MPVSCARWCWEIPIGSRNSSIRSSPGVTGAREASSLFNSAVAVMLDIFATSVKRRLRVMIFSGIDDEPIVRNLVHQAVFLIDATRPHAGQLATQGPGLPDAVEWIALDSSNEPVEPFQRLLIVPLSPNINVLRIVRPDFTHRRPPPARARKPHLLLHRRGRAPANVELPRVCMPASFHAELMAAAAAQGYAYA